MTQFCLIPKQVQQFKQALKDGSLNPEKLSSMTSEERHAYLEKFVGKENSQQVNALFESKLLLKNQKAGMISWAKRVSGISPQAKRDIISRIEKMDKILNPTEEKAFLKDLATQKLGVGVSAEEAKKISDLSKKVQETRSLQKSDFSFQSKKEARAYSKARNDLANYLNELKGLNKLSIKSLKDIGGISKSARASYDNSSIFRQGWKTLLTHPGTWAKDSLKTFTDIAKQLGNKNVMDEIMIEKGSRLNDLNGNYKKMNLALSNPEEAFPTSIPEKIPVLGRAYKASEVAYTGFVYRLRMDIADKYLEIAKKSGVDLTDKELKSIGSMVNSITGRGNLGKYEGSAANLTNNVFFSPRFIKSQFDTLGHVVTGAGGSNFVRKQAAINLVKIITGTAAIMSIANTLNPGSAETDPRSSDFGKIKVGNTRFDITGGMGSLLVLASRLAPILIGQQPISKSSTTGQLNPINSGKYGAQTGQDVVVDFLTNKLSPVGQVIVDLLNQKDRSGNKLTPWGEVANLTVPLSIATYNDLKKDPNSANTVLAMIADGLGIATNNYGVQEKNWSTNPTKAQSAFKSKVGDAKFTQANDEFNKAYDRWFQKMSNSQSYKKLSPDEQSNLNTKAKAVLQDKIFKKYGFEYKQTKNKKKSEELNKLLP